MLELILIWYKLWVHKRRLWWGTNPVSMAPVSTGPSRHLSVVQSSAQEQQYFLTPRLQKCPYMIEVGETGPETKQCWGSRDKLAFSIEACAIGSFQNVTPQYIWCRSQGKLWFCHSCACALANGHNGLPKWSYSPCAWKVVELPKRFLECVHYKTMRGWSIKNTFKSQKRLWNIYRISAYPDSSG